MVARRAFTLIEALVSSLILAMAIAGMFASWSFLEVRYYRTREAVEAAQIGRSELEMAKVYGIDNLPIGTFNAGTQTGTWVGAYDPTSGLWVTNGISYFDLAGNPLAGSNSNGTDYKLQMTLTDYNVQLNSSGPGYTFDRTSKRTAIVTVTRTSDNVPIFTQGTTFAQGGI